MPRLCEVYRGICLTTEVKAWKNLSHMMLQFILTTSSNILNSSDHYFTAGNIKATNPGTEITNTMSVFKSGS